MKMTKFEKFFVNSEGRSQRVAECAERMLRLAGLRPARATWISGAATVQPRSILRQSWDSI
jgi:hypothetical protein